MKVVKWILGIILGILALGLILAIFVEKEYETEVYVQINMDRSEVFDYVVQLKNQDSFSVWSSMDPEMQKTYTGTDGTVGFISAWDSDNKNVGKGEQEITAIIPNEKIEYELRFLEPFESTDHVWISFEDTEEGETKIYWGIEGKMNYPMNIMLLFLDMDGMLEKDLQQGLENLKEILE